VAVLELRVVREHRQSFARRAEARGGRSSGSGKKKTTMLTILGDDEADNPRAIFVVGGWTRRGQGSTVTSPGCARHEIGFVFQASTPGTRLTRLRQRGPQGCSTRELRRAAARAARGGTRGGPLTGDTQTGDAVGRRRQRVRDAPARGEATRDPAGRRADPETFDARSGNRRARSPCTSSLQRAATSGLISTTSNIAAGSRAGFVMRERGVVGDEGGRSEVRRLPPTGCWLSGEQKRIPVRAIPCVARSRHASCRGRRRPRNEGVSCSASMSEWGIAIGSGRWSRWSHIGSSRPHTSCTIDVWHEHVTVAPGRTLRSRPIAAAKARGDDKQHGLGGEAAAVYAGSARRRAARRTCRARAEPDGIGVDAETPPWSEIGGRHASGHVLGERLRKLPTPWCSARGREQRQLQIASIRRPPQLSSAARWFTVVGI